MAKHLYWNLLQPTIGTIIKRHSAQVAIDLEPVAISMLFHQAGILSKSCHVLLGVFAWHYLQIGFQLGTSLGNFRGWMRAGASSWCRVRSRGRSCYASFRHVIFSNAFVINVIITRSHTSSRGKRIQMHVISFHGIGWRASQVTLSPGR